MAHWFISIEIVRGNCYGKAFAFTITTVAYTLAIIVGIVSGALVWVFVTASFLIAFSLLKWTIVATALLIAIFLSAFGGKLFIAYYNLERFGDQYWGCLLTMIISVTVTVIPLLVVTF